MRMPLLLTSVTPIVLALVLMGGSSTSSSGVEALRNPPRFSSVYTNLTRCGSGLTRKQEKELEAQGSDIPTKCKGFGGYDIGISYSACTSTIQAEKGETGILLATQGVDWKQKTVEWRMADGKPFAIIMRVYAYGGSTECGDIGGKITGSSLIVKGLAGYERIDGSVDVKATPNANAKAREIADKGYDSGK
jgi:hypothetical protein